jgi:hypothetical protein
MADTKIEMKINEKVKPLEELCSKLVNLATIEIEKNPETIDTREFGEVVDMIKDLSEAKKHITEMMYQRQIMNAMEEAEYCSYKDEDTMEFSSRLHPRSAMTGRFIQKNYTKIPEDVYRRNMRDMDMPDRMYYTDGMAGLENPRDYREGKAGEARKIYMQAKEMHKSNTPEDKQEKVRKLDEYWRAKMEDLKEESADMTPEEKSVAKSWLTKMTSSLA